MKTNQPLHSALILTAGILLSTAVSHAALSYHVMIDTSSLNSLPDSNSIPFALDFQFNAGGTPNNNTASIKNFNFNGGNAIGSATNIGSAVGDLNSEITFDDTTLSELFQEFNPGSAIEFDMTFSDNEDGTAPDSFSVAILDSSLLNIPTSGIANSLVQFDVSPTATANIGSGTGVFSSVVPVVTTIPEPSALALLGMASLGLIIRRRRIG